MEGWVKIHRQIAETGLWTLEPFTRGQAWVDLIMLANYKYGYFYLRDHKVEVQRGQVGWSQLQLGKRWKWSRTKVRKFLNDLEKEQQLIQHQTFTTTVITIVNYELYQEKEQQQIQQKNSSETAEKQQRDTNKKNKESKERKESKEVKEEALVFPFSSEEFINLWQSWKEYKKQQHRFTYKCVKTEQAALMQLGRLAGGDEPTGMKIIEQSIANGWQGLFELKNQSNGKSNYGNNGHGNSRITEADRSRIAADLHAAVNKGTDRQD